MARASGGATVTASLATDIGAAVDNLRQWRELATPSDVHAGRDWYPLARKIAGELADAYGQDVETVAGVIAVLSPQTEWMANVRGTETILRAHAAGEKMPGPGAVSTTYYENVRKAWNILQTGATFPRCNGHRENERGRLVKCHPNREGSLCPARAHLHGPKVTEFFETIMGKRAGRVVDVWATRAADVNPYDALLLSKGDPRAEGIPGTRIAMLQDAYAQVAADFGEDPRDTQAIVWTTIRRSWRTPGRALQMSLDDSDIPF